MRLQNEYVEQYQPIAVNNEDLNSYKKHVTLKLSTLNKPFHLMEKNIK